MEAGQRKVASTKTAGPRGERPALQERKLGAGWSPSGLWGRTEVRRLRKHLCGGCGWAVRHKSKEHRLKSVLQSQKRPPQKAAGTKIKDGSSRNGGGGAVEKNRTARNWLCHGLGGAGQAAQAECLCY